MRAKILRRPEAVLQPRALDVIIDPHRIKETANLPKCEAKRSGRYCGSYEDAHPDKTCTRSARYEIDGVNLCSLHAGEVALTVLLRTPQQ